MEVRVSELERLLAELVFQDVDGREVVRVEELVKKVAALGVTVSILPDFPPPPPKK
jgi:hypothetical protein